jgi:hypothetical protein
MGSGGEGQERRERTEEVAAAETSVRSQEEGNPREREIFFIVRGPLKAMSTLWHSNSGSVQLTLEVPLVAMEYANMDNNV